jgi:hypothetical protein
MADVMTLVRKLRRNSGRIFFLQAPDRRSD